MSAPHNTGGRILIQTSDPEHSLALDVPFDKEVGMAARRFIPAFLAYSVARGLSPYQERVAQAMQECGVPQEDSVILARLAWVVLLRGLDNLCETLDRWVREFGLGAGVPLAPLHLWALGEAAGCYLLHLDPTAAAAEVAADAKLLDSYFGDYCIDFNVRFSPYTSLVVDIPRLGKEPS